MGSFLRSEAASSVSVLLTSGAPFEPGPMVVRVTTIVAPNQYWAHEIPPSIAHFNTSKLKLVLEVERCLAVRYNGSTTRGIVAPEDLTLDLYAVRRSEADPHWYRGKITSVLRRPDEGGRIVTYVTVFLVDYGNYIPNVEFATNVRTLPHDMQVHPAHLAFSVKLAGLRPQELDLTYNTGMKRMTSVVTDKWAPAATDYVKHIFKSSAAGIAELKNYHVTADGVRHGQLIVRGRSSKRNLSMLLERQKYAVYDQMTAMADMANDTLNQTTASLAPSADRSLSMCVPPTASDGIEEYDFGKTEGKGGDGSGGQKTDAPLDDSVSLSMFQPPMVSDLLPLERCGKWTTLHEEPKSPDPVRMQLLRAMQDGADLAEILSTSSTETTEWAAVRDKIDTCATADSEDKLANPMLVPAGIDTGLLLERQLRETDDDNQSVGPKKIQRGAVTVTIKVSVDDESTDPSC